MKADAAVLYRVLYMWTSKFLRIKLHRPRKSSIPTEQTTEKLKQTSFVLRSRMPKVFPVFGMLVVLLLGVSAAAFGGRRLEAPTGLNNQQMAKVRDEIVATLEVKISHMNSTSSISGSDLVKELLGAISDVTGIAPPSLALVTLNVSKADLDDVKQGINDVKQGISDLLAPRSKGPAEPSTRKGDKPKHAAKVPDDDEQNGETEDDEATDKDTDDAAKKDGEVGGDDESDEDNKADNDDDEDEDEDDDDNDDSGTGDKLLNTTALSKIRDRVVGELEVQVRRNPCPRHSPDSSRCPLILTP